ncbi:MAG: RHS repeat-associated core domain-containing protein, partial [Nocardioides sp.]|uniref:EndoU domain-containing protein n=1 Tax=Nocardioides sp. TaxID=35761 RepID=UPI003D6AC7F0
SAGRLIGVEDRLTGARRFELDLADRITTVALDDSVSEAYSYDPLGNITRSTTGSGDAERRDYDGTLLTRAGRSRYAYDSQGRLTRHTRTQISEKPDTWIYEWDANDRLTAVRTPDSTRWTYLYDALGRRVAKRRHDEAGETVEQTDFAWDGIVLVEQTGGGGNTLSWAYESYQPLAQVELIQDEVDARFYSIVTDLAGAPSELVNTDGDLVWHARRNIWGVSAAGSASPLRFAGQYADDETGLYYNYHRYYDPSSGRYLSQDPLGLAPAPNPSAYVSNPTVTTDLLGLSPCRPGRDLIDGDVQYHIISGNRTGGGHKWPGQPGKTVFPPDWDTERILNSIAEVATSPSSNWTQQTGKAGALLTKNGDPTRWKIEGVVDGVNVRVIFEPVNDRIVTGFPFQ